MKKYNNSIKNGVLKKILTANLKMKLTGIFMFMFFLQIHAGSYGQDIRISIDLRDSSIERILDKIEQLTSYKLLYSTDDVDVNRKSSIVADNETLNQVLTKLFEGMDTSFIVLDEQIILRKTLRTGQSTVVAKGLQRTVKGLVLDNYGLPLLGVSVVVKGENRGATTDFDGKFSIQVTAGDTLVLSFIGFSEQEVPITKDDFYTIRLQEASFQLQGVEVVSNGYQTISKERATGAFDKVPKKVLESKIIQDVFTKIEGEVTGLLFDGQPDQTGTFGSEVTIRGVNTFQGERKPLIVLDGFPLEGTPTERRVQTNTINPNDIESISVLKDAAAASIWGIRAANGVIVIKTKQGQKNQKITAQLSVSTAITQERNFTKTRFASAADQIDFVREAFEVNSNQLGGTELLFEGDVNGVSLPLLNPAVETILLARRGDISAVEAESRFAELSNRDIRREISKAIRSRIWNQYNLALYGGGANYTFNSSILFNLNQNEILRQDSQQLIANIRNTFDLSDKIQFRSSINYTQRKSNNSFLGANPERILASESILGRITDENGLRVPMQNLNLFSNLAPGANQQTSDLAVARGFLPLTFNVLDEIDNSDDTDRNSDIRLQAAVDYKINKRFTATASYQYEQQQNNNRVLSNENTFLVRATVAQFAQLDPDTGIATEFPVPIGSFLDVRTRNTRSFTARAQLNYDRQFNDGLHKLTALAGYEVRRTVLEENINNRIFGYNNESLTSVPVDLVTLFVNPLSPFFSSSRIPNPGNFRNITFIENRFVSSYANMAYTYDDTYTLSGSIRLDDTNLFGSSNRFRNIPLYSLGFKWNMKRNLFPNNNLVNRLDLRATFGENGNVARRTSPFLLATIEQEFGVFNNLSAAVSNPPNPLLRLERTQSFNLGLDFGLFNSDAIDGTIEYYRNRSDDLLAQANINTTLGVRNIIQNIGEITNEGINASLRLLPINTANFRFETKGNFSFNTNRITRSDIDLRDIFTYTLGGSNLLGDDVNAIYSFRYGGLDNTGSPQYINQENEIDNFENNTPDVGDLVKSGTTLPPYFGSWINEVSYKNFSFRVLTTFKAGHIFRASAAEGLFFDPAQSLNLNTFNAGAGVAQRWRVPGDENRTRIPRIPSISETFSNRYNFFGLADEHIASADHIRLNQITLAYALSDDFLNRTGLRSLNLSLQADNIAVWNFNQFNIDPEATIPRPVTISFRLTTSF